MRFKARILPEKVDLFVKICHTLQKIAKDCVLHLSERKAQFILSQEMGEGNNVSIWSGITATSLFDDYSIQSLNNNEIAFEISLEHLIRALKSCASASDIGAKLTKKNGIAFFSISIEIQSSERMSVVQDIPVTVLSAQQIATYSEPTLQDPDVHILMPPLKLLKPVVDRMKKISEEVTLFANMAGELAFKVRSDMVSVVTTYRNLEHPPIEGKSPLRQDATQKAQATIDIKKFSKFLASQAVAPTNVILCIVKSQAIVLHVLVEELYLTYYINVLSSKEEMND